MTTQDARNIVSLGQVVATRGALEAMEQSKEDVLLYLTRHASRDWGEVPPEDWEENEFSVGRELRVLSAYSLRNGTKIWIITEADRSVTTILLPSEY
jgi:hypothetical protein